MKAFERQTTGYSEQALEGMFGETLFPSAFFNQPVPVRGVCFAAGEESLQLAHYFVETHLNMGVIAFRMEAMTNEAWRETSGLFTRPRAEVSNVGFLLRDLDLTSPELQEKIAEVLEVTENVLWFATVGDHRRLSPRLKLPFLVYLGLGQNGRMRFMAQSGQQLRIDEGSLKRPSGHGS
jgi:hypothetical protein